MHAMTDALGDLFRARDFHRKLLKLGLPMALSAILSSSLQILDTLMIAQLGDVPVAAVGLANRLTYLMSFFTAGISSGAAIFAAQYWGEKNREGLRQDLTLGLMLMLPVVLAFFLVAFFLPRGVMRIFSSEEEVIAKGAAYLRLIAPGFLFQGLSALLAALLKATGRASIPMVGSTVSILLNVLLNYLLIFGKLGLPALGERGAALGTLISALVEAVILVTLARTRNTPVCLRRENLSRPSGTYTRKFLKTSVPILINEVGWALGVVVTNWVYSTMGTAAAAASSVYETIKAFVVVCCVAVGAAGGILIGHDLGAGDEQAARTTARRVLLSGLLLSIAICPVMLALISPLLSLYGEMSLEATGGLRAMLTALACLFWIKMCDYDLINGVLRAGGDTKAAAAIDVGCMWAIMVPIVFVTGYLLKWPLSRVFPLTFLEDAAVALLAWRRYKKGYWIQKLG